MIKAIKSKFEVNQNQTIKITQINHEPNAPVNVYIHGYGAFYLKTSENDFKARINQINGYEHVFVRWPSEHYSQAVIEGLTKGLTINHLKKLKSTQSTLAQISTPLVIIGIEALTQIKKVQNKTKVLDVEFIEQLKLYIAKHNIKNRPINFIAHSFGSRLLLNSLSNPLHEKVLKELHINNIVLMGGAVDREEINWSQIAKLTQGKIHNCFSKKDWALAVKPDLDKNIGRYPIKINDNLKNKLVNHELRDFDHKSYWRRLDEVLTKVCEYSECV